MLGEFFAECVELSGGAVTFVADRSPEKEGRPFAGVKISTVDQLAEHSEEFDFLLVAHHLRFDDIRREAISMGIKKEKIMMPYEV